MPTPTDRPTLSRRGLLGCGIRGVGAWALGGLLGAGARLGNEGGRAWAQALVPGAAQPAAALPEMVTPAVTAAIEKGEAYLARTQGRDGLWRTSGYPTAMTSIAGMGLLAGGHTPIEGKYSANVRRAVDALVGSSTPSGLIARLDEERSVMHGHGFAMMFLGESYGMERSETRQGQVRRALVKAIRLTAQSQSGAGGWLYTPDSGGDEGSVTVTQIQGLRSCRNAGIKVPKSVVDRAAKYIENSANPDGGIRYRAQDGGPSRPAISAAAVATLYNAGAYENPVALKCLAYIKTQLRQTGGLVRDGHQFYMLLYAGQAMYLSSDENWRSFFPKHRDWLVSTQQADGSWNGDTSPVYCTGIALMTLQLPFAYLPILQR